MADVNQWRQIMNRRSKTPTLDYEERKLDIPSASTSDAPFRKSRPIIPRFLSSKDVRNPLPSPVPNEPEPFSVDFWSMEKVPPPYRPDIAMMARGVMATISSNPYKDLPNAFNSQIMHVFEAYSKLAKEKEQLMADKSRMEETLAQMGMQLQRAVQEVEAAAQQWALEIEESRQEIDRLELQLVEGQMGATSLRDIRQQSLLRRRSAAADGTARDILDFLHNVGRTGDSDEQSQARSSMETALSPSYYSNDQALLFVDGVGLDSERAYTRLLEGSTGITAVEAPGTEKEPEVLETKQCSSDDSYSTFDTHDQRSVDSATGSHTMVVKPHENPDSLQRTALDMALRHGISVEDAMTKISQLVYGDIQVLKSPVRPDAKTNRKNSFVRRVKGAMSSRPQTRKSSLRSARSLGSTNSLQDQSSRTGTLVEVDTTQLRRVYSFEQGDDKAAQLHHPKPSASTEHRFHQRPPAPRKAHPLREKEDMLTPLSSSALCKLDKSQLYIPSPASSPRPQLRSLRETSNSSLSTVILRSPRAHHKRPNSSRAGSLQGGLAGAGVSQEVLGVSSSAATIAAVRASERVSAAGNM